MTLIINPGSRVHVGEPGQGWTNTYEEARAEAERWLARMHDKGMTDVELDSEAFVREGGGLTMAYEREGRWVFVFRHRVTRTTATLETHGVDNMAAYLKAHIFTPTIYWNGSSISEPELEDFAAPGFVAVRTFKKEGG